MSTSIPWTDESWNPVIGCSKVSDGCRNCYAERMACRQVAMGNKAYAPTVHIEKRRGFLTKWTGEVRFVDSVLEKPLHWRKPRRIFLCSMGDLFHKAVPDEWLDRVFWVIDQCPEHTFQILTKRPKKAARFLLTSAYRRNVHLYVSISSQHDWEAYGHDILKARIQPLGVSYEPALRLVHWRSILRCRNDIGHVICGGESGAGARPMEPYLVREARDACQRFSVPFFFKGWGTNRHTPSGIELDGRTWTEMPEGADSKKKGN